MSAQSLNNSSLQLRELTVSNEYDSKATGYVAKSTVITSESINTSSFSSPSIELTGILPVILSNATNEGSGPILKVNGSIEFNQTTGQAVNIYCLANSALGVNGSITCGGIIATGMTDANNSYGTAGQVPTANGSGGWVWTTPA
jgi:hypothetical protein